MAGRHGRALRLQRAEHLDPGRRAAHRGDHLLRRGRSRSPTPRWRRPAAGVQPQPGAGRARRCWSPPSCWRRCARSASGWPAPTRTLVISSSARTLTTAEKMQLGDGRVGTDALLAIAAAHSRAGLPGARHGGAGARGRHRDQRGDVRRDRRQRRAALRARRLRGDDPRRRQGRRREPARFRARLRRRGSARVQHAGAGGAAGRWRHGSRRTGALPEALRAQLSGRRARDAGARPCARAGLPGRRLRRAVPAAPGARAGGRARGRPDAAHGYARHARDGALAGAVDGLRRHRARRRR